MSRTVLITGASGSMGREAVRSLADEGWHVIMACRNLEKGEAVMQDVKAVVHDASIELHPLDLASLASVRSFAAAMHGRRIDVLFNNAGTISRGYGLTEDGYERTFQVNCIGPCVLMSLLRPQLEKVVSMISLTCSLVKIDSHYCGDSSEEFSQLGTYARAKLGLLLGTMDFSCRTGIPFNLADPGIVNSNMISMDRWFDPLADIFFRPFISTPEKGVSPALRAIRSDDSSLYYVGKRNKSIPVRFLSSPVPDSVASIFKP
ncbi:MAG: SDR family NAD(P)-dependent oxidoreductase [Bacteroidia bacterium]|nr:SDR family NAD(P)-dependent oxidoreductase [Bacteroidia bacterium]